MNNKEMIIKRLGGSLKQTIGNLLVRENNINIENLYCLELPDRSNKTSISRIPQGIYDVNKRTSNKFGHHFHVRSVPNRKWILIHSGNTYKDTRGCIIVGDSISDINNDGETDVLNSRKTLDMLLELMPDKFKLKIYDE